MYATLVELIGGEDRIDGAAESPVEIDNDKGVSAAKLLQGCIKDGAFGGNSGDVFYAQHIAAFFELHNLSVDLLALCGDADIADMAGCEC